MYIHTSLKGQYFLYDNTPLKIDLKFSRHSLEASSRDIVFNSLLVKNSSNKQGNFLINISVPEGWKVLGQEKVEVQLSPFDSTYIPVRVAVGNIVKGDIGYSIIASASDLNGTTIKNEYCYIKIPRKVDLTVKIKDRIAFIDPAFDMSTIKVSVSNKGNREEPITFLFDGKNFVGVSNLKSNQYLKDVVIQPYSDSIFEFPVYITTDNIYSKTFFDLALNIKTTDTTLKTNVWLRKIDSRFVNHISSGEKPLIIEVSSQGLLDANRKPITVATIEGKILFKGNNDIYYYYRNFSSKQKEDFYKNTKMFMGANIGSWKLELGDNYRAIETITYGRGGFIKYDGKKIKFEGLVNSNIKTNIDNLGGQFFYHFNDYTFLRGAYTNSNNSETNFKSELFLVGGGVKFLKKHLIEGYIAKNFVTNNSGKKNEFGTYFSYKSTIRKISNNFQIRFASPYYYSSQSGRMNIDSWTMYKINRKVNLNFLYTENQTKSPRLNTNKFNANTSRFFRPEVVYSINNSIQVFGGPVFETARLEGLSILPLNEYYSNFTYKASLGLRLKFISSNIFITPKVEIARGNVQHNPFKNLTAKKTNYNYQFFSLNFRSKILNILAFYTSGPKSSFDQLNYMYFSKPSRRIQLLPYVEGLLYKDIVKGYLGINYSNDIVNSSTYTNITGQLNCYLNYNWEIRSLVVYSIQNRTNVLDAVERYHNFYAELTIRKEFGFHQPRVKFYNIDLVFFKDFNGNRIQDANEPGIKNILTTVSKINSNVKGSIPGDINAIDLLSDNIGSVSVENIPEGIYQIEYNPIGGDLGSYSKSLGNLEININRDGVFYIPFAEKNKVFGKIIINRSRLSSMGKLDLSNIRITATDSRGNTFSTLTDKNGEFTIFAPVTDEYIVNINNIFYENFDLRQNNFRVQFNGYKQFEVNYVFDEKIRRINFSPSTQDNLTEGVMQIRKTNLRGTIKDATSLKPLRARINLVNTKNNSVVSSVYSNPQTGDYALSFMAEDIYVLEILADDYWYFSENLNLNQVTTFMNVNKDILLKQITIGSKVELNIKFLEINKAILGPETVAELNRLLKILRENSNIKVEVQGHCDDIEALSNPQIAEDRAKAVAKYLIENGFNNIQVRGFGNTAPIAPNDTEENRTLNRRVELEVISK